MKDLKSKFKRLGIGWKGKDQPEPENASNVDTAKTPGAGYQKENASNTDDAKLDASGEQKRNTEEHAQQLAQAKAFVEETRKGSLRFTIQGPSSSSPRVSAHVHRYGSEQGPKLIHSVDCPDRGFVKVTHPSFEQYRISKKFIKRQTTEELDQEDYILLDAEASPVYENVNPGTVTVEGFGLDYWDAMLVHGRAQPAPDIVRMPEIGDMTSAAVLLRRLAELRSIETFRSPDREQELADLKDILGTTEMYTAAAAHTTDHEERILTILFGLLNQGDRFMDLSDLIVFSQTATGFNEDMTEGAWNFYLQMMVAKELALRLQSYSSTSSVRGFSIQVLSALIISDLWLRNTKLELVDMTTLIPSVIAAREAGVMSEDREKADEFIRQGDEKVEGGDLFAAGELYSQAIIIDLANFEYIRKRAEIMLSVENYLGAVKEAVVLRLLDPTRAIAESILGRACMGYKNYMRARDAFQRAVELAENETEKAAMLAERDRAETAAEAEKRATEETDEGKKVALIRTRQEATWDSTGRAIALRATKYERQLEGLVLFAKQIKWPYLAEVRDGLNKAYRTWIDNNEPTWYILQDWMYAVTLPGATFSQTIMTALIYSSPSVEQAGQSPSNESGLVLADCTYWRVRSVLGRVLGCLPGVVSVNGWVGPCPTVRITAPGNETPPQHCVVTTFYFNPDDSLSPPESETKADESLFADDSMLAAIELTDTSQWITLDPPAQGDRPWELKSIDLKRWKLLDPYNPEGAWLYAAELMFRQEGGWDITFGMQYNPVFVTLPPCDPGEKSAHEAHPGIGLKFKRSEISVSDLYKADPRLCPSDTVIVVNATAKGAEVVARAWCAQHGKSAIVRRAGGPCYACAIRAASRYGLRVGILIWIS